MKTIRLDKWLANAGLGTRTEVKKAIKARRVQVNDKPASDPGMHVHPQEDTVLWDGEPVVYEKFVYFLMNKPQGIISATEDLRDPVVTDLLAPEDAHYGVFPVGRLDKDTEGLLLLTNDGDLAHRLLSPKKHVPKVYFAKVKGRLEAADVEAMQQGVTLEDGYEALPAELKIITSGAESTCEITVYEGKFHQVKRMFAALGKEVTFLKRLSMGDITLDESLATGEYRRLTEEEKALLL